MLLKTRTYIRNIPMLVVELGRDRERDLSHLFSYYSSNYIRRIIQKMLYGSISKPTLL